MSKQNSIIGSNPVAIFRFFAAIALSAAILLAAPGIVFAQSLSDASLAMSSDWSGGYMGLGSNLGEAIHRRREVKPARQAASAHAQRRPARKRVQAKVATGRNPIKDTPVYLVAQSLDHSGLTLYTLPTLGGP
ncbi:MAG: hypothetical protein QM780_13290 [Hyphomicrobium sp.]|uniref:hypothetical protein n=1 Tax=Hyphomicrobium sp. TaxID=82 RepID=UPI0039E2A01F